MQPDFKEELYARGRMLFIDLLKLGLTLSTGMIAALGLLTFNKEFKLHKAVEIPYYLCLACLLLATAGALSGWFAQAMYYVAGASQYKPKAAASDAAEVGADGAAAGKQPGETEKDLREKWRRMRNVAFGIFISCFLFGSGFAVYVIGRSVKVEP